MDKERMDELYHLMRVASNSAAQQKRPDIASSIYGLSRHLLAGGDYLNLIQYCAYYGESFLLQPTCEQLHIKGWKPERIVEFGAGLGWLGRGLSVMFSGLPALYVDKRHWTMIDIVADLETAEGMNKVAKQMRTGDLIVMSDFLHCIESPKKLLTAFSSFPMAILEYMPTNEEYVASYTSQLERYGGNPIPAGTLESMLSSLGRRTDIKDLDPYILILIDSY